MQSLRPRSGGGGGRQLVPLKSNTLKSSAVGPIWPGLGIARCCAPSKTDNSSVMRTCLMGLIVPEDGVRMPLHARMAQQLVGERHCMVYHSTFKSVLHRCG